MTDAELLIKIKNGLGITGDFQNDTLKVYIDEVKAFMISAGVSYELIESEAAVGCILRGVADLWNYGNGNAKLSEYFKMRLIQLKALYNSGGGISALIGTVDDVTASDYVSPEQAIAAIQHGRSVVLRSMVQISQSETTQIEFASWSASVINCISTIVAPTSNPALINLVGTVGEGWQTSIIELAVAD